MRTINFTQTTVENTVDNVTKVSPTFVTELKTAFRMFPPKANMRFKQDFNGRLIIIVTITYNNGKTQTLEGFGDADLISAIQMAMGKNIEGLHEYSKTEHDVEIATESENLVVEILRQYLGATTRCNIEKDWFSSNGERYRKVTFTPSFNMNVKFCLKATDEINNLITEACKPDWMKKAEQEELQKEESNN